MGTGEGDYAINGEQFSAGLGFVPRASIVFLQEILFRPFHCWSSAPEM
jgi:hypothetical protein